MNKQDLEINVLKGASIARQIMIEQHGSFYQQAILIDKRGGRHVILIADDVLHGPKMRQLLIVHSLSLGGADAILVMADARCQSVEPGSVEEKRIARAARQGRYIVAANPRNQEILIVVGRSREHQAGVFSPYRREAAPDGDRITFHDSEPKLSAGIVQAFLIPDIWERTN